MDLCIILSMQLLSDFHSFNSLGSLKWIRIIGKIFQNLATLIYVPLICCCRRYIVKRLTFQMANENAENVMDYFHHWRWEWNQHHFELTRTSVWKSLIENSVQNENVKVEIHQATIVDVSNTEDTINFWFNATICLIYHATIYQQKCKTTLINWNT